MGRLGAVMLATVAFVTQLYRGAISLALDAGLADLRASARGSARDGVMHGVALVALTGAAWCIVAARRRPTRESRRRLAGAGLVAAGWTWFAWGVVDHYVFDRWQVAPGTFSPVWETLFHGVGVIVGVLGWRLLHPRHGATAALPPSARRTT